MAQIAVGEIGEIMLMDKSFLLPKYDTQNNWDFGALPYLMKKNKVEVYKELSKHPNSGIYGVFHSINQHSICLYVGASTRLKVRVARFLTPKARGSNFYIQTIMDAIHARNDDGVAVRFFFVTDTKNLPFFEEYFIEKYRPAMNISKDYGTNKNKKRINKAIDTHNISCYNHDEG